MGRAHNFKYAKFAVPRIHNKRKLKYDKMPVFCLCMTGDVSNRVSHMRYDFHTGIIRQLRDRCKLSDIKSYRTAESEALMIARISGKSVNIVKVDERFPVIVKEIRAD